MSISISMIPHSKNKFYLKKKVLKMIVTIMLVATQKETSAAFELFYSQLVYFCFQ